MATTTLADGFGFVEGPRWRGDRLFFSDMGTRRVLTVDLRGKVEEVCEVEGRPSGIGWLPDGRMLVVSVSDRRVLRLEEDGRLVEHADLSGLASAPCNDMVVDARGNAYVGNPGYDMRNPPVADSYAVRGCRRRARRPRRSRWRPSACGWPRR